MNNRRKQLMLASAKEYCKCVVEGKTIKYNQLVTPSNNSGGSFYGLTYNSSATSGLITISGTASYTSGDPNIYGIFNVAYSLKANHKYIIHSTSKNFYAWFIDYDSSNNIGLDGNDTIATVSADGNYYCVIRPSDLGDFDGNTYDEKFYIMLIDLTELGLDSISSTNDFLATDLGKYIAKGNYLPYEPNGKFIHAQSPINFKGLNLLNLSRNKGTLSGFSNSNPRLFQNNNYYLGLSANNYYSGENVILDFEKTATGVTFKTTNTGYGMALPILVKPNKTYRVSFEATDDIYRVGWYDIDGNFLSFDLNYTGVFNSPKKAYWGVLVLAPSNTNLNTYSNIIFCENALYQNKYEPYCGTNVLMEGFVLQKGDYYKTYEVDKVNYNNLIPNANQDYVNDNADTRADIILTVYNYDDDTTVFVQYISLAGFYEFTFTSNATSSSAKIYNSGVSINQYFTDNISIINGHLYYLSLDLISCDASTVGSLRVANLRLIDLTQLGLSNLTDKLRIFLQKNYKLPYTTTNKTIKDQIVRTMKEIDFSTLTWTWEGDYWDTDISNIDDIKKYYQSDETPNAIAEKYRVVSANQDTQEGYPVGNLIIEGSEFTGYYIEINSSDSQNAPTGKMLIELLQPTTVMWQTLDIENYNEFVEIDPHIFKLNRDLSDYGVLDVTNDIGTKMANLTMLNIAGANGDFCYQDGYIYQKTNDIESVWIYQIQISNAPSRMVSRRTINVESENGIDMDFTKE